MCLHIFEMYLDKIHKFKNIFQIVSSWALKHHLTKTVFVLFTELLAATH